jgi:DNA-binding beta-propeller fold protein YncE
MNPRVPSVGFAVSFAVAAVLLPLFVPGRCPADAPRVVTLAGSGKPGRKDAAGREAAFHEPFGICTGDDRALFVADSGNHCIRRVSPQGDVTTFAGTGDKGTVDGPRERARFDTPSAVRADGRGNLYVCSYEENTIRVVDPEGNVRSLIGKREPGLVDGTAEQARVHAPRGMVFDRSGNLYFSDCWNHRIRKIAPDGTVTTLAGGGPTGVEAKATWRDGTGAEARFYAPCGMAIDADDNLYVADAENHRIRRITPAGVVTTIAGHGASGKEGRGFADGPAAASRLNTPTDVFVTGDGTVYFSDTYGNRIRRITPQGMVSTLAGTGEAGLRDGPADKAAFNFPRGIVVRDRTVLLADFNNHVIRSFRLD